MNEDKKQLPKLQVLREDSPSYEIPTWLPIPEIFKIPSTQLSTKEKSVACIVISTFDNNDTTYVSNSYIGRILGFTDRTIGRTITTLDNKDLLARKLFNPEQNLDGTFSQKRRLRLGRKGRKLLQNEYPKITPSPYTNMGTHPPTQNGLHSISKDIHFGIKKLKVRKSANYQSVKKSRKSKRPWRPIDGI